jgi:hypothetical protein
MDGGVMGALQPFVPRILTAAETGDPAKPAKPAEVQRREGLPLLKQTADAAKVARVPINAYPRGLLPKVFDGLTPQEKEREVARYCLRNGISRAEYNERFADDDVEKFWSCHEPAATDTEESVI